MNLDARRNVILSFIVLVVGIYLIRLFYMQVIDDTWTLRAQEIAEKRKEIFPPRGVIFDRNGKKIVTNQTHKRTWYTVPCAICGSEEFLSPNILEPIEVTTDNSLWYIKNKTLVEDLSNRTNVW